MFVNRFFMRRTHPRQAIKQILLGFKLIFNWYLILNSHELKTEIFWSNVYRSPLSIIKTFLKISLANFHKNLHKALVTLVKVIFSLYKLVKIQ